MKTSVDISLYPLSEDYIPAIKEFIDHLHHPGIIVTKTDLSTQLFGDYDVVMDLIKSEIRKSWEKYGEGIFVIKYLLGDLRGLADE